MKHWKTFLLTIFLWSLLTINSAFAQSAPVEVKISLGSSQGDLKFFPSQLNFVAG
jgi:hypothetical protein